LFVVVVVVIVVVVVVGLGSILKAYPFHSEA
jgi:hypothetical protein